jgi:DNA-binding transcriptional ArsR family regulator
MARQAATTNPTPADPRVERLAADLAGSFKLLADPVRLGVVLHLARAGEADVSALCAAFGVSQPTMSQRLSPLRLAGVVGTRREGRRMYYGVRAASFGEQLGDVLSANGEIPGEIRLGEFLLSHEGG